MRAGNKKLKKKVKGIVHLRLPKQIPDTSSTTWASSLSLSWTKRNLVHQSKWEFSITPVDGGMCCLALAIDKQTQTKEMKRNLEEDEKNNNKFSFYFYRYVPGGMLVYSFDGSFARGKWCWSSATAASSSCFILASYPTSISFSRLSKRHELSRSFVRLDTRLMQLKTAIVKK